MNKVLFDAHPVVIRYMASCSYHLISCSVDVLTNIHGCIYYLYVVLFCKNEVLIRKYLFYL
jgi:hypothetical protein